jgi:hypothetical protein
MRLSEHSLVSAAYVEQLETRPVFGPQEAQSHVGSGTETDRGGATRALGEMESSTASQVSGIGPRFPQFHSQIFRFHAENCVDINQATV